MTDPATNGDAAGVVGEAGRMDAHETAEARVLDPDEYTQKRRIKDVLDARRLVSDVRMEAEDRMATRDRTRRLSRREASRLYRTAVHNYVDEVRPLMTVRYPDAGREYWEEADLGAQVIEPPEHLTGSVEPSVPKDLSEIAEPATPVRVEIVGLKQFVKAPRTFGVEFKAEVRTYDGLRETRTEFKRAPMDWKILDTATWAVNKFLAKIGMDLDADDRRPLNKAEWEA